MKQNQHPSFADKKNETDEPCFHITVLHTNRACPNNHRIGHAIITIFRVEDERWIQDITALVTISNRWCKSENITKTNQPN